MGALQVAGLQQVRLVDVHDRVGFLGDRGGRRLEAYRSAAEDEAEHAQLTAGRRLAVAVFDAGNPVDAMVVGVH